MKRYAKLVTGLIMISYIAGCTGSTTQGNSPMRALSLTIQSPVKAGVPYPAKFICTMPPAGVDSVKGYFFWNQEGPFEYPLQKYEVVDTKRHGKCSQLTFNLYTGRPDTYTISGYCIYRNIANGSMGKTEKISAGAVTVH